MKWKLKSLLLASLSRVPGGRRAYHRIQKFAGTNVLRYEESLARCLELIELVKFGGVDVEGMRCVEIGTGWRPFVAMFMRLAGAERILTLDVNPWLDHKYILETYDAMRPRIDEIADSLGLPLEVVKARFPDVTHDDSLIEILDAFQIEYRCPGDARRTQLPDNSVDAVISSNVLEHIPPDVLSAIHQESFRILKPGGVAAHRFNPGDHFSHSDPSITGANFLQYSSKRWYWHGGSGLAYHNRLRCREHLGLFNDLGFEIVHQRVRQDKRAVDAIDRGDLVIHPDFAHMTVSELAADYMWITARVPEISAITSSKALRTETTADAK
jgi:hypothetical protein